MAFWNRKKTEDTEAKDIKNESSNEEMSDELRAITEALEEEQSEKEAKARARAEENEKILKEREEVLKRSTEVASGYIKQSNESDKGDHRQFYMVVECPADLEVKNPGDVLVEGVVYGKIRKGDEVFLFQPDNSIVTTVVEDLRTEPSEYVDEAENTRVIVELKGQGIKEAVKFAVLTNADPNTVETKDKPVTNPRLLGLSLDFNRFGRDTEYFTVLVNAIIRSEYLTHAKIDKPAAAGGKSRIGILSIPDNTDKEKRLIPVFTDAFNMSRTPFGNDDESIQPLRLSFHDLSGFATTQQHDGFVVNPFGPVSIKIPKELLLDIRKNPAYIKEFGNQGLKVEHEKVTNKTQIFIGVPPENAEYKSIRSAVLKFCQNNGSIKRAGIVMKMEEGKKEAGYLCIIDCPKESEKECYMGIYASVKPFLNLHKKFEFSRYDEAPFANDYFAKEKLIYEV